MLDAIQWTIRGNISALPNLIENKNITNKVFVYMNRSMTTNHYSEDQGFAVAKADYVCKI